MMAELSKKFFFEAAHALVRAPDGHRCRNLHGHTYELEITVEGPIDPHRGWVIDYGDIKKAVKPVVNLLDHSTLNDTPGLEQPTSEHLCVWFWDRLAPFLPGLKIVTIRETPTSQCRYMGPGK